MALPEEQRARLDAIVQRMTADGQSPDAIRMVVQDFKTKYEAPTEPTRGWGDTITNALPTIGGMVGGFVGKVPGIRTVSAAIGGAAGEGYRQIAKHATEIPGAMRDVAANLTTNPAETLRGFGEGAVQGGQQALAAGATQGAAQGAGEGVGMGVRWLGPRLRTAGVSAYERMLKPNKSTLEGMAGMGKDLQSRSRNVAEALITDPNGQISKRGASRYADATSGIQAKVNEVVDANPEARGSTSHLVDALRGGKGKFAKQWAPGGDMAAYTGVADEVLKNSRIQKAKRAVVTHGREDGSTFDQVEKVGTELIPRVRANTARELTQGTYRNLGDQAYGELKGAATEAHKAAARGGRAILNEALPQVAPMNNEIAKRIDLGQVLDEAVFRSGKHDPIGLGERVILGGGNLGWLPASIINRPGVGSKVARGVYKTGAKAEGANPQNYMSNLIRAAILAQLEQD